MLILSVIWVGWDRNEHSGNMLQGWGKWALTPFSLSPLGKIVGCGSLSWHLDLPPQERDDASEVKLFLPSLMCLILDSFAWVGCWNLHTGLPSFHRDIPIQGCLSKSKFLWGMRTGISWSTILLMSLSISIYFCVTNSINLEAEKLYPFIII